MLSFSVVKNRNKICTILSKNAHAICNLCIVVKGVNRKDTLLRRKDLIMANSREFNLFSYVYGRLFAEQYFGKDGTGCLFETSQKIYSWQGVLYWFKKEGYLLEYQIGNADYNHSVIAYKFNRQKTTFERYIKAIERSLKKNSLEIEPMGDLIEKRAYNEFEAQYKKPVEYLDVADRCLKELNEKIMEQLRKADSEVEKKVA